MNKDFKIYTHNLTSIKVQTARQIRQSGSVWRKLYNLIFGLCYYIGLAILGAIKLILKTVALACFHIGNILWMSTRAIILRTLKDIRQTKTLAILRWKLFWQKSFFQTLLTLTFLAILSFGIFSSLHLLARGLQIKDQISSTALLGKSYLTQAKDALVQQDFQAAQSKFLLAYQNFQNSSAQLSAVGQGLNQFLDLIPQKRDADRLLEAASLISQSGQLAVDFYQQAAQIKFSIAGLNSPAGNVATLNSLNDKLSQLNQKLTVANQDVLAIDPNSLPKDQQAEFLQLQSQAGAIIQTFQNFQQLFILGKTFVLGDKKILLLFENNNELRSSGGFIGTYGLMSISDGKITNLHVSSIYDLDGQLREKIKPPLPILNVNDRWFMRDANWFADFPQSAQILSDFYEKEGGETPDVVLIMTPNLIVDLLKLTGSVAMPDYHVTLDADNFVEQTQVTSDVSTIEGVNLPKQVLADFVPIFLQKLEGLSQDVWPTILDNLQQNLLQKQIAVFARDPQLQSQLDAFGWTGRVADSDRDYLTVNSSNLGGTKTDLYLDQKILLKININEDGTVVNDLSLTRTNRLPKLNKTNNLEFIRVLVPKGSQLLSNTGFDYKSLEFPPEDKNFKVNSEVEAWESTMVKDVVSGTFVGEEAGKTFFGNWLNVEGGETKTVELTYRLPFKVNDIDHYSLLLQKQLGAQSIPMDLTVNFSGRHIEWKSFDTSDLQTNNLTTHIDLNKDNFLGVVFSKNK